MQRRIVSENSNTEQPGHSPGLEGQSESQVCRRSSATVSPPATTGTWQPPPLRCASAPSAPVCRCPPPLCGEAMASTSPLLSPVDVLRQGPADPTGLRRDLNNGGVKRRPAHTAHTERATDAQSARDRAASLLPGVGSFTRSGRRSTVAINLRVKPAKQVASFNERQERLCLLHPTGLLWSRQSSHTVR